MIYWNMYLPNIGLYTSVLPEISQPTEKCFPLKWNYKP